MKTRIFYLIFGICCFVWGILISYQIIDLDGLLPNFHKWGNAFFPVPVAYSIFAVFTQRKHPYRILGSIFIGVLISALLSTKPETNIILAQRFMMIVAGTCLIPLIETIRKSIPSSDK